MVPCLASFFFGGGSIFYHITLDRGGDKKPRFTGFFVYINGDKKRLPFAGESYRSSKPIAGQLRSKP